MAVTREAIRGEVLKRIRGGITGTATGGTTTTCVVANDVRFDDGGGSILDSTLYEGDYIRFTSGDEDGTIALISDFTPNGGTLTLKPTLSNAIANTNTFEIHRRLHPNELDDCISRALRAMYYVDFYPLSLVSDPDMETSGVSGWTNSNATPTKDTDAADNVDALGGAQSLQVVTSSTNGYSYVATVDVQSESAYSLWVMAKADGAFTASVIAYDQTNSAAIDSKTWAHRDWGIVEFGFQTPSNCDQISIRLGAQETSATVHFDNLIVQRNARHSYELPSWLANPEADIIDIVRYNGTTPFNLTSSSVQDDSQLVYSPTAANPASVVLDTGTSGKPVFVKAVRPFLAENGALSTDATTTDANFEWVCARAVINAFKLLKDQAPGSETREWENLYAQATREARRQNRRWDPRGANAGGKKPEVR